jgi:hypothetical protein
MDQFDFESLLFQIMDTNLLRIDLNGDKCKWGSGLPWNLNKGSFSPQDAFVG